MNPLACFKKLIAIGLLTGLVAAPALANNYCSIAERCASILLDANSGEVLSASDADKPVYPASLTKLMTLYLLFEVLENQHVGLNNRIRISPNAAAQDPSKIGLRPGETISVEDAIEAIAVKSANDIAVAVAEAISGSVSAFAYRMNSKAVALGMTQTSFRNPSGLPDESQYTTARDMATLARRTLSDFPNYRHYLGLTAAHVAGKSITGHNRLLNRNECDGGKTGFIRASGFNLVAWKQRDNRTVIGAVFGGDTIASRDYYMTSLLRSGFGEPAPLPPTFASIGPRPLHLAQNRKALRMQATKTRPRHRALLSRHKLQIASKPTRSVSQAKSSTHRVARNVASKSAVRLAQAHKRPAAKSAKAAKLMTAQAERGGRRTVSR